MLKMQLSGRISALPRLESEPNSLERRNAFIISEYGVRGGKKNPIFSPHINKDSLRDKSTDFSVNWVNNRSSNKPHEFNSLYVNPTHSGKTGEQSLEHRKTYYHWAINGVRIA